MKVKINANKIQQVVNADVINIDQARRFSPREQNDSTKIFMCYAREDEQHALAVYEKLQQLGFQPWMDKKNLLPGQYWEEEIPKIIKNSDFVLIFFSKIAILKRGYVQAEFKLALNVLKEIPEGQIFIIPVRIDDCKIPERFVELHYCNLFEADGFEMILKSIRDGISSTNE